MLCPECNISGGCYCHEPPKVKYLPIDHEKELERYLSDLDAEIVYELEKRKNYQS